MAGVGDPVPAWRLSIFCFKRGQLFKLFKRESHIVRELCSRESGSLLQLPDTGRDTTWDHSISESQRVPIRHRYHDERLFPDHKCPELPGWEHRTQRLPRPWISMD